MLAAKEAARHSTTPTSGTEHLLLGLLREGDGVAARVLRELGVDVERTRQEILKELDPSFLDTVEASEPSPSDAARISGKPEMPQDAPPSKPQHDSVDTSKRYNVYCAEREQEVVVYRNALFKGTKDLFPKNRYDSLARFVELEQADGQTIFIALYSVIKFCEHGATPSHETVTGMKP